MRHLIQRMATCLLGTWMLAGAVPARATTWLSEVDTAVARAQAQDTLVMVDLYADWCGWCKVLESKVFSTPEFAQFAEPYVLLRVDVEDGAEGTALRRRYGAWELPTLLLLTARNSEAGRITGYYEKSAYLDRLRAEVDEYEQFRRRYQEERESADPLVLQRLGMALHRRHAGERARAIWERLWQLEDLPADQRRWLSYLIADTLQMEGKYALAAKQLAKVRAAAVAADDTQLLPEVESLSLSLAREQSGCAGVDALEGFLAHYPESRWRGQALHLLSERRDRLTTPCA